MSLGIIDDRKILAITPASVPTWGIFYARADEAEEEHTYRVKVHAWATRVVDWREGAREPNVEVVPMIIDHISGRLEIVSYQIPGFVGIDDSEDSPGPNKRKTWLQLGREKLERFHGIDLRAVAREPADKQRAGVDGGSDDDKFRN